MNWAPNWKVGNLPEDIGKRLIAVLLVGGCVGLLLWSVMFRLSLVTEAQSHVNSSFSLKRELDRLRSSWLQDEADKLKQDWEQFQAQNFTDYDQVLQWTSHFSARAQDLGFQVTYKIGEEGPSIDGVSSVKLLPIQFTLRKKTNTVEYDHFMQFMKEVTESEVSVTLDKVEFVGNGRSLQMLNVMLVAFMSPKK